VKPAGSVRLLIVNCELTEANAFVSQHHRHHRPVIGHRFSLAVVDPTGTVHGVAIIGRPTSRMLDNGWTLEVTRTATDGFPNACSALYSAARRACFALGYRRLITFTLASESGVSLRASGWRVVAESRGGTWSRSARPRVDKHPLQPKLRWEAPAAAKEEP